MPSLYQLHVDKWKDCNLCSLCETRNKIVLARGQISADVLFVGEAPGASENVLGRPFVGPAGKLLDEITAEALKGLGKTVDTGGFDSQGRPLMDWASLELRIAFTNLVACIPLGEEGKKTAEPSKESILACQPRLREIVEICKPRLLVTVGKLSDTWVPKATERIDVSDRPIPKWCSITHPAAILRADITQKSLAIQRCIVTLRDAFQNTFGG